MDETSSTSLPEPFPGLAPVIALTGGIGSGKSTVAALFSDLGARIIDADLLARQVVEPGTPGLKRVIEEFGERYLASDGNLDRTKLATLIFGDLPARQKLESILHPLIRTAFLSQLKDYSSLDPVRPVIYVVPLFYEAQQPFPEVKKVIVVWAPDRVCAERLMVRNSLNLEQATQRIRAQMPIDLKVQKADWTIRNGGEESDLSPQVAAIWREILS